MIFAYKLNSLCKNLHPDIQYIACYSPDLKCSFDKFYLDRILYEFIYFS